MPEYRALGAELVAISPQLAEHNRSLATEKGLTFEILGDPGNRVARAFGLTFTLPDDLRSQYRNFGFDLELYNGDDSWTLPIPARYLVDRDGTIRYAVMDPDHTIRPDPKETLKELESIVEAT